MSNRFSCVFNTQSDFYVNWYSSDLFMGLHNVYVKGYNFFYCAQPLVTSAAIEDVRTNLREYYVKRLKIDYLFRNSENAYSYIMVFVLNVPDDYVPSKVLGTFKFSDLPSHTMPECVLYYGLFKAFSAGGVQSTDIKVNIKKPFKISPSHKLAFVYYLFARTANIYGEGTAEVFFEVN